ncbi:hypothetical protein H5410_048472 [Solanum commersonii]|uniref:Uncharacterized protein n=1 Tax=Solanum commersonii TaxID=4109 RepID=A0A9J5XLU1_SOLCO|nr:hypothetical protein H5410_048472 [Solanum commersonii]
MKYHELQQLEELLNVALEKLDEVLAKLKKKCGDGVFPSEVLGSDLAPLEDDLAMEIKMEPTNIERLLKAPVEELKYHELQQLEEILKVAIEIVDEALAKLKGERGGVFSSEILGSDLTPSKDE